jgi:hypothetical protein
LADLVEHVLVDRDLGGLPWVLFALAEALEELLRVELSGQLYATRELEPKGQRLGHRPGLDSDMVPMMPVKDPGLARDDTGQKDKQTTDGDNKATH